MHGQDQTREEHVVCNTLQEGRKLLYRCHGPTCATQNQGRRYLDLVSVVFPSEDGHGHARDVLRTMLD